jgi:hypothetical protein
MRTTLDYKRLVLTVLALGTVVACLFRFSSNAARITGPFKLPQQALTTGPKQENRGRVPTGPPTLASVLAKNKHSAPPPVGEFGQAPNESKIDHDRRQIRENLHGKGFYRRRIDDPGAKEVNGQAETVNLLFLDGVTILKPGKTPDPQGLPVSSDAVVVGTILRGKAFVADNRDFVYSDYVVRIDRILKPDVGKPFHEGDEVTTWLPGGSIHFPSGHTKHFIISGRGFPEVGTSYVLFLGRSDPRLNEYEIWTGYAIKNGVVLPLDEGNERFENADAESFLVTIQDAIRIESGGRRTE